MRLFTGLFALSGAFGYAASLSQMETNGKSLWGTLDAPAYPLFMAEPKTTNNLAVSKLATANKKVATTKSTTTNNGTAFPWGQKTAKHTNAYKDPPDTGITRKYTFDIARGKAAPDGYQKDVILINDQFPGPLIEANWGDMIEVIVNNNITGPDEGTALHWHGLLMKESPWSDGVPGVSQCPITPRGSFTYKFKADLYGTSWYHSHYSAQYAGGLFGPIVIHGPTHVDYDIDLGPIPLSDWFHKEYFDIVEAVAGTNSSEWRQYSDNNLISGKMNYNCSLVTDDTPCSDNAGIAKFKFHKGKKHLLRLINTSAAAMERFSIDGHNLTVVANDFVPVQPYEASYVTVGVGQRVHVIVEGTGPSDGVFWMRSNISEICNLPLQPHALAAVYYEEADTDTTPNTTANYYPGDDGTCTTDPLNVTIPYYPMPLSDPDFTQYLEINETVNATGHLVWTINDSAAHVNYNEALYLLANEGNVSYPYDPQWNVYDFGRNKSVRLVINNVFNFSHPVHLHGHNMYILSEGPGPWDGKTIVRPENPQRRDTQMLRDHGHLVVQYDADNPGVWPLHCHVAWHVSMGFFMSVIERPDDILKAKPPQNIFDTCKAWNKYTEDTIVEQIDSGV